MYYLIIYFLYALNYYGYFLLTFTVGIINKLISNVALNFDNVCDWFCGDENWFYLNWFG